jgi:hypothetical protein
MSSAAVAARRRSGPTVGRQSPGSPVRLTGRGRALVALACIVLAMAAVLLIRQAPTLAGDRVTPRGGFDYVVVEPGQTLWQIAEAAAPGVDPRVTIMRIQDLNGLPNPAVVAGTRIAVPRSG